MFLKDLLWALPLFDIFQILFYRYVPLFDYFKDFSDVAFRVVADDYVTSDSGTGIVHCAPAFGEDDYRVCIENHIINKVHKFVLFLDFLLLSDRRLVYSDS